MGTRNSRYETLHKTQFAELAFTKIEDGLWMFVDVTDSSEDGRWYAQVGAHYPTRETLLADLQHYAAEFGCANARKESTLSEVAEKVRSIKVHRVHSTIFIPLPPELWRSPDNGCVCPVCQRDGTTGYWDTLAVSMHAEKGKPDSTWTVHYPELHSLEVRKAKAIPKA